MLQACYLAGIKPISGYAGIAYSGLMKMDRLHYGQNFEKRLNGKIHYHSIEEHPKISKIAKFGREML